MRSKTQRIVGVCGVVAGLFLSNPAAAAPANDNITCANASGDAAIAACGRAIASRKFKGIDLAQLYYNRGVEYAVKGECDRAIADYNQAIRLDPKYVLAYNKRGDCFTRQGSNFRALEDYAKAIELDPTNSRVYFNRGDIFRKEGDFDRAISEYTESIRLEPKDADAFNRRGIAHLRKGEYERAITDQTEAIRFNPKHAKAFNDRCWAATIVGRALQQALADCNESLRLDGNDPDAIASRGFTYLKLGQLADAIVDYDAALKVAPKHASSLYGRGVVKLRQGDVEGGNADLATATAIQANIADEFARYGVAPVAERAPGSATLAQGAAKPAGDPVAERAPSPATLDQSAAKPAGDPVAERAPGPATLAQGAAKPAGDCARAETHWKSVEELKSLAAYEDHLARFPNCEFATLARLRIDTLKR
jgi:tetratricopeptide (TPR) repeat protein